MVYRRTLMVEGPEGEKLFTVRKQREKGGARYKDLPSQVITPVITPSEQATHPNVRLGGHSRSEPLHLL